ncbi:MAG TPA: hypothetical protein VGK20_16005 [Candidatus Binatia bacterium]|jgi:hypothetical protein
MQSIVKPNRFGLRAAAAACAAAWLTTSCPAAVAQAITQLNIPQNEYAIGGFHYNPPKMDGWREIANLKDTFALIYAEQKEETKIDTRFGVTFESHDIPDSVQVPDAAGLALLSRDQMADSHKTDLVAKSPIEPVPSIPNLYTYRLLVHVPVKDMADAYEVYYLMASPDRRHYLVAQCVTRTQDYANDLYFTQFYGSLTSLKYVPSDVAAAPAGAATAATDAKKNDPAPAASKDAPKAGAPASH